MADKRTLALTPLQNYVVLLLEAHKVTQTAGGGPGDVGSREVFLLGPWQPAGCRYGRYNRTSQAVRPGRRRG